MPVKRQYSPVPVAVTDSGKFLPDFPAFAIGLSDYTEKTNWERYKGTERKRAGWDYPAPTEQWTADMLATFDDDSPCEAIEGIRRPNGTYAVVGCGGGKIKAFSYDLNDWVTIGSGYSVDGQAGFLWWQIVDCDGYAVFNNGRDLFCTWQVGDAAVLPVYEFRESGYASCGHITEYYGVLICANILEIDPSDQSAVMNGADPYGTIVAGGLIETTRIGFERAWSNIGNPRDFAAVVAGTIDGYPEGSTDLVLEWPMASFEVGDLIRVTGAGAAGGNLTTTIAAINGVYVTLTDPAESTVTDASVGKTTAFDSIVGTDELEGDGSTIIREMALKNQLISYKESGEIFQSYYTASVTQPFASQRMSGAAGAKRPIRFPRALVNVLDQYHLFPGAANFYQYQLSAQEPVQHPLFAGVEKTQFFDLVTDAARLKVWGADNTAVGQIFFAFPLGDDSEEAYDEYSARRALSFTYREGDQSVDVVDDFSFLCAATCQKPIASDLPDPTEQWFLMGATDGHVTLYGRSNTTLYTQRRYGELFDSVVAGSLMAFGQETLDKYMKRLTLLMAAANASGQMTIEIYGARQTNDTPVLLVSKDLTDPIFPGVANVSLRRAFLKYRFVCGLDSPVTIGGHVWLLAGQDIDQISQIAP